MVASAVTKSQLSSPALALVQHVGMVVEVKLSVHGKDEMAAQGVVNVLLAAHELKVPEPQLLRTCKV